MVRNPTEVRSLMEAHYEKNEFERREGATVIEVNGESARYERGSIVLTTNKAARREKVVRREQQDVLDFVFVAVAFPLRDYKYFALERKRIPGTNNRFEYLIDWEASERYRAVPAQTFKDLHEPGSEAEFRVSLQGPGTYFQPPFNADEWRCYSLTYPGDPDFQFFGYTKRDTDVDQKILELFVSSGRPAPIIKVAYPKANVVDSACVEITELMMSTWFK